MTIERDDLLALSDFAWQRLRTRVEGLTDEEYLWEPVEGSWSVRPDDEGIWRADGATLPPDPAPVTTIAWRLSHLADLLAGERNATWIGLSPGNRPDHSGEAPTATENLARLEEAYAFWRGCLSRASDLDTPMGPIAGPYAEGSRRSFLHHELDEFIHHGAEVGVLRDLYAASQGIPPLVTAALAADRSTLEALLAADPELRTQHAALLTRVAAAQRWDALRLLLELNFPVDPPTGTAPVHYAAGAGQADIVALLVERGADLSAKDHTFNETPQGWARFFGHPELAETIAPR